MIHRPVLSHLLKKSYLLRNVRTSYIYFLTIGCFVNVLKCFLYSTFFLLWQISRQIMPKCQLSPKRFKEMERYKLYFGSVSVTLTLYTNR